MALYRFEIKILSRGQKHNIVAAAAYRSGERLKEKQRTKELGQKKTNIVEAAAYRAGEKLKEQNITHDYRKKENVVHTEIMLPENASRRFQDREKLWNEINRVEKRKDAQLAREFVITLPRELTIDQNKELVNDFIRTNFVNKGLAADISIHSPTASDRLKNTHAHVLLPTREFAKDGEFARTKNRNWNKKKNCYDWRKLWAGYENAKLKEVGIKARVDHRSYKDRGMDRIPGIPLGKNSHVLEKIGVKTSRGDIVRKTKVQNAIKESLAFNRKKKNLQPSIQKSRNWVKQKGMEQARGIQFTLGRDD